MDDKGNVLKRISLIFLACMISMTATYGQSSLDLKLRQKNLQNRIRNQESWDYRYEGKTTVKAGSRTSVTTYTSSGEIDRVVTYNTKGQVQHVEEYSYDSGGRRTGYTRMSGGNSQKPSYQKISAYDQKGNVSEEKGFDGVDNFRNLYLYDASGTLTEINYYANNVLKEKRKFSGTKQVTYVDICSGSGTLVSKLVLQYDDNGNMTGETVYGLNQAELEKKLYYYDQNSNLIAESRYKLDKKTLTTTYNYNVAGDLASVYEETPFSVKFLKKDLSYDEQGNLKEIKWRRNSDDEFNVMLYTYDAKGICTAVDTFYPETDYRVLTKYVYAYF